MIDGGSRFDNSVGKPGAHPFDARAKDSTEVDASAKRNAHVRFPELVAPPSALEGLVVDMAYRRFLPYANLPSRITATNIEAYSNWISELTQQDTRGLERAAVLHVRDDDQQIIYPVNPDVGNETNVASISYSKTGKKFLPTLDVHSHNADVPHSPAWADMGTLLAGFDGYVPPAMLVATPGHNYLIIKSQETPTEMDRQDVFDKEKELYNFVGFNDFVSSISRNIGHRNPRWVEQDVERRLGEDLTSYYQSFIHAINLSNAYNLGFYRSEKDGTYVRMTREMITDQMYQRLDEVLQGILEPKK